MVTVEGVVDQVLVVVVAMAMVTVEGVPTVVVVAIADVVATVVPPINGSYVNSDAVLRDLKLDGAGSWVWEGTGLVVADTKGGDGDDDDFKIQI
jgi:hypothetical protein